MGNGIFTGRDEVPLKPRWEFSGLWFMCHGGGHRVRFYPNNTATRTVGELFFGGPRPRR